MFCIRKSQPEEPAPMQRQSRKSEDSFFRFFFVARPLPHPLLLCILLRRLPDLPLRCHKHVPGFHLLYPLPVSEPLRLPGPQRLCYFLLGRPVRQIQVLTTPACDHHQISFSPPSDT